jgi:hypothetical protein
MDIFSIDFTHNEIAFIRQCLDLPSISGKDAKFLANLQSKIESELVQIDQMKQVEAQKKAEGLQAILEAEQTKANNKK